jgi:hypothetical protein
MGTVKYVTLGWHKVMENDEDDEETVRRKPEGTDTPKWRKVRCGEVSESGGRTLDGAGPDRTELRGHSTEKGPRMA